MDSRTRFHVPVVITTVAACFAASLLTGCVPVVIGAAAGTGYVATQERTVGRAVDDATIKAGILHRFTDSDVAGLLTKVSTEVTEGRVLLTGSVLHQETAIEAVTQVWRVKGVKEVINEIQVSDKGGVKNYATDTWITTQIKSRLLVTKYIRSTNYNIETVNNVVYIIGLAQNQQELDNVMQIARTTQYVQQVISHVILKTDPRHGGAE